MPAKTIAAHRNNLGVGVAELLRFINGWSIGYHSTLRRDAKGPGASIPAALSNLENNGTITVISRQAMGGSGATADSTKAGA
jgi:hypothetical protein